MIELSTSPDALSELSPVAPPKLLSQAQDASRDNLMVYVKADNYLGTETSLHLWKVDVKRLNTKR